MAKQSTAAKLEQMVAKKALKVLKIEDLNVDRSYQRDLKSRHKRIVGDFNEDALGVPTIGQREDGSYWIVDGQQRIEALKKLGRTVVRCDVFPSTGPEHEALIYKLIDERQGHTPAEAFRALLTSHDVTAWAIKEAVEKTGFQLGLSGRGGKAGGWKGSKVVVCINTLMRIAKTPKQGVEAISTALRIASECWPDDTMGVGNNLMAGLAIFYARQGGAIDMEKLIPRFREATPHRIIYTANQMLSTAAAGGLGRSYAIADQLEKLYRKRSVK